MNSAFPPPVLIGTKRPSALETCSVHGRMVRTKATARIAAPGRRPRISANSPNTTTNARYSGRANAVRPSSTPGTTHASLRRPGSPAQKLDNTAPASVSVASGSLISLPVKKIVTG